MTSKPTVGDTVIVQHSPGPDGAHEIVETFDRGVVVDNGARIYDHELDRDYLSVEKHE